MNPTPQGGPPRIVARGFRRVAQTSSLLYRRFLTCWSSKRVPEAADYKSAIQQIKNLRYGQTLATLVLGVFALIGWAATGTAAGPARDYPAKPVPFTDVHLTDVFWAPRIETNRVVTIPFAFEQ